MRSSHGTAGPPTSTETSSRGCNWFSTTRTVAERPANTPCASAVASCSRELCGQKMNTMTRVGIRHCCLSHEPDRVRASPCEGRRARSVASRSTAVRLDLEAPPAEKLDTLETAMRELCRDYYATRNHHPGGVPLHPFAPSYAVPSQARVVEVGDARSHASLRSAWVAGRAAWPLGSARRAGRRPRAC